MLKADRSSYSVTDLFEWYSVGKLVLTPKFQRRSVWNSKARSFLIDSILLDMPIPPIYIRVTQNEKKDAVIREVIDGQQRLAAVFAFMNEDFALSKTIEYPAKGKRYSKLTVAEKDRICRYTFISEVFQGISDDEVLKLFSRLNSYSVKLNDQELRHGQYFGPFKVTVYELALQYLEFWRKSTLFSEQSIARMLEAEFVSELLILMLEGPQDKKKSIDKFYDLYDDEFPERNQLVERFSEIIGVISEFTLEKLPNSEFNRSPLFYALFGAIYHRLYRLKKSEIPCDRTGKLTRQEISSLGNCIQDVSVMLQAVKQGGETPQKFANFIAACSTQTDNLKPRITRITTIFSFIFQD